MKTLQTIIRNLLAVPLTVGLPMSVVHAAPQYFITDLGTLGGAYSNGVSLNDAGQIAGYSHLAANASLHAFIWQDGTGLTDLTSIGGSHSLAAGMNNSGLVVGNSMNIGNTDVGCFVWNLGASNPLSTLGGASCRATSANDNGAITGAASLADNSAEHAVFWSSSASPKPTDLGALGGKNSQGNDINFNGQIVGYAQDINGVTHAALWVPPFDKPAQDLGTLGGTFSEANAINAFGQVTGISSNTGDTQHRGFIWQAGQGMTDLGALTPTSTYTGGLDINANGEVVGFSTTAGGAAKRAIIRKVDAPLADLNGQILPNTGWILTEARSINNAGQITGIGTLTKVDTANNLNRVEHHAFLLTPDKVKPTITCPAKVTTTGAQPIGIGQATANDNLDPAVVISNNRPVTFPNGDTTVVWNAIDANGNTATCSQLITIGGDTTPPNISFAISPSTVNGLNGWYVTAPAISWTVADAESAIISQTGCTPATVNDNAGQIFTCSAESGGGIGQTATPAIKVDTIKPVLVASIVTPQEATSTLGAPVTFALPTITENGSGLVAGSLSCSPVSGSAFVIGSTSVTCTANDNAGNSGSVVFPVSVVDTVAPILTVPANISQQTPGISAVVNYTTSATDSGSGIAGVVNCLPASGSSFPVGTTQVACSVSDRVGNNKTAGFTVTIDAATVPVTDATAPTVTPTLTGTLGQNGWYIGPVTVTWAVVDAESAVTTSCSSVVISTNGVGQTRSCTATSAGGTRTVSTQPINIDTQAPVFTTCAANVTLTSQPTTLAATDNLSTSVVTRTPSTALPLGTPTSVTWRVSDSAGLSSTCAQTVTVSASVTETISARAQCKRRSATEGEWSIQGTSSVRTNNSIQLYTTATVPTDLTTNRLGTARTVSTNGDWTYQAKPGPACRTSISLRSSATGTTRSVSVSP